MRILTTGIGGFVGGYLTERLIRDGQTEIHGIIRRDAADQVGLLACMRDDPGPLARDFSFPVAPASVMIERIAGVCGMGLSEFSI